MPQLNLHILERRQTMEMLNQSRHKPLTVVCAPAGFGKTTAVATWLHSLEPPQADPGAAPQTLWYSLSEHENQFNEFLSCLVDGIRSVFPQSCSRSVQLSDIYPSLSVNHIAKRLCADLEELPAPLYLALDDYHLIQNEEIHGLLNSILRSQVAPLHLILISRVQPPLNLARLRANHQLTEIGQEELAFDREEAAQLFQQITGHHLSEAVLSEFMQQTAGWVAGLRLIGSLLDTQGRNEFALAQEIQAQGHEYIFDYFVEEVLNYVPASIQRFLAITAILPELRPDLCDHLLLSEEILGQGILAGGPSPADGWAEWVKSEDILNYLAEHNFFTTCLQNTEPIYRYHPQFKLLLQARLKRFTRPEQIRSLQQQAVQWYEAQGWLKQAMHLQISAGEVEAAADLLERNLETIYAQESAARLYHLDHFFHILPPEVINSRPKLLTALVWVIQTQSQPQLIYQTSQRIHTLLAENASPLTSQDREFIDLQLAVIGRYQSIYRTEADLPSGAAMDGDQEVEAARRIWQRIPVGYQRPRGVALLTLSRRLHWQGRLAECKQVLEEALAETNMAPTLYTLQALSALSQHHMMAAQMDDAERINEVGRSLVKDGKYPIFDCMSGVAAYERLQGNWAERQFERMRANAYFTSVPLLVYLSYFQIWHNSQIPNQPDTNELAKLRERSWKQGIPEAIPTLRALEAHADLLNGRTEQAIRWATEVPAPVARPIGPISREIWIRCQMTLGTPDALRAAQSANQEILDRTLRQHEYWNWLAAQIRASIILHAQGRTIDALPLLAEAIRFGVPKGFRLIYTGYGSAMTGLTERLRDSGSFPEAIPHLAALERDLRGAGMIASAPGDSHVSVTEPDHTELTNREMEILSLMADHLTNREIAETLFISPHTVRNHVANIFQKLQVTRRREAVELYQKQQTAVLATGNTRKTA